MDRVYPLLFYTIDEAVRVTGRTRNAVMQLASANGWNPDKDGRYIKRLVDEFARRYPKKRPVESDLFYSTAEVADYAGVNYRSVGSLAARLGWPQDEWGRYLKSAVHRYIDYCSNQLVQPRPTSSPLPPLKLIKTIPATKPAPDGDASRVPGECRIYVPIKTTEEWSPAYAPQTPV